MSLSDEVKIAVLALLREQLETVRSLTNPPPTSVPNVFVGPYTNLTATVASPSQSLLSSFPEVEAATIASIINHEFEAHDLYKLDPKSRDKTEGQILSLRGGSLTNSAFKDYKSLSSVAVPLSTYFSIILVHAEPTARVSNMAVDFFRYNSHLIKISDEYEWAAVVAYHMAFFDKRRREMQLGDYSGWGRIDVELQGEHLHGGNSAVANKPVEAAKERGSNVEVAMEEVDAPQIDTGADAEADEKSRRPRTERELSAAVTIQQAYRRYRGRCSPPPDATVAPCREYYKQALAESSSIRWKSRRYKLLFLGAVPHAMVCFNSIDAWGTAYKRWVSNMIDRNSGMALRNAQAELIRILQFLDSAQRLKSNLEPQSKLHIKGDIVQLKNDVRDLQDLIARISVAYPVTYGPYPPLFDEVNDDLQAVVQSVIVGPVKAAAAANS
ncbi:hypothetical protein V5O48_014024 [Marasmius crinis-equi]|uniref:Uncharacterized protein n=1 Tax=Marasmius crinis-equi TaxID=585013 RepID=A0ABR3EYG5_9AGAR